MNRQEVIRVRAYQAKARPAMRTRLHPIGEGPFAAAGHALTLCSGGLTFTTTDADQAVAWLRALPRATTYRRTGVQGAN